LTNGFALRPSMFSYVSIVFTKANRKQMMSEAGTAYHSGAPYFLFCMGFFSILDNKLEVHLIIHMQVYVQCSMKSRF